MLVFGLPYFATDRGRPGYDKYGHDFAKLIGTIASPNGASTMPRSIAPQRPATTQITSPSLSIITSGGSGWLKASRNMTIWKSGLPKVRSSPCPPLPLKATPMVHPDARSYAKKFAGKYSHRIIKGGVGHNLPQEAPQAFAEAVVEAAEA